MRRAVVSLLVLGGALGGCGGLSTPSPITGACDPSATTARAAMPLFGKPFVGDFPVGNLFDHDKPLVFGDSNGYLLTLCGDRQDAGDTGQTDGHDGYDWRMAEGTPILAVADGLVMFAGTQAPAFCPPLGRNVQAVYAQVLHRALDGTEIVTVYGHLSRVSVAEGSRIDAGTVVGLSGNTGCSGTPHLHFSVFRGRPDGSFAVIDPYGWHAPGPDPWEADPRGLPSVWLWREGSAPPFR
jgi:murein DD-endopeptidase MepM/ murein hydrolase activator NlpD